MTLKDIKKGDRVRNLEADEYLEVGDLGTAIEDNDGAPAVLWDNKDIWAQVEDYLEVITEESK